MTVDEHNQSMRDLIIELKVTLTHFTARVDEALQRNDTRVAQLERQLMEQHREIDQRIRALERYYWIAIGMVTIVNLLIPFARDWITRGG